MEIWQCLTSVCCLNYHAWTWSKSIYCSVLEEIQRSAEMLSWKLPYPLSNRESQMINQTFSLLAGNFINTYWTWRPNCLDLIHWMYSSWHVAAVITAIIAHSFFSIWKDSTRNQSLWVLSSRHQTPQFQFYYPYHWTPWNSVSTTSLLSEHKLDFYICCLYGLKVIHNNSLEIWKMASYLPEITLMSKFPLKKAERRFKGWPPH